METVWEIVFLAMFVGAGILIFAGGFKRMHKIRMIKDIPRSTIRSLAVGLGEIHGNVKSLETVPAPFSQTPCVFYKYEIKEYRRKRSGKKTTYSWDTIASGDRRIPFLAHDETGEINVNPQEADYHLDATNVYLQKAGLFGGLTSLIDSLKCLGDDKSNLLDTTNLNLTKIKDKKWSFSFNRVGDRKYYEYLLLPEDNLYLMGTAAIDIKASDKLIIVKGEDQKTFIISNKSEQDLIKSINKKMILSFFIGILFTLIGVIFIMKRMNLF